MAKTLAIRALQRGVGSMDYVDSLLLLEPEDENGSDQEPNLDANTSPVRVPQPSRQSVETASTIHMYIGVTRGIFMKRCKVDPNYHNSSDFK